MIMNKFVSGNGAAFTSDKDDWETPQVLFDELNAEYHFELDAAASDNNHKLDRYYTAQDNALLQKWTGNTFVNPPYGRHIGDWVAKAYLESIRDGTRSIVMLIPARTDTRYWHEYIFPYADIKFLKGRLKFEVDGVAGGSAPFPSAIIVFGGKQ